MINMVNKNIEVEGGELLLESQEGHYAIVPAKDRQKVMAMLDGKCNDCINEYIAGLPKESDYAEDGSLYTDFLDTGGDDDEEMFSGGVRPEVEIKAEAPGWLKHRRDYVRSNPFNIDEYVENRYNNPVGREAIKKIDRKGFRDELRREGLERRYNAAMDYTAEQLVKDKPMGKMSRAEWLNSLSDKEEQIVKRNPKYQTSIWDDAKRSLISSTETFPFESINNIATSKDFSEREKRELIKQYKDHPNMSKLSDAAKILSPLSIPYNATVGNMYTQSQGETDYSAGNALAGRKPKNTNIGLEIVGDPLNLVGAGVVSKLGKASKLSKLDKVTDAAKSLANKGKTVSSVDDVGKGFKSEIDWAKWNKEIPENKALMQEYKTIEQQTKASGSWMKNPDGSAFQGTPEQFVQQNSENFKKAFPEGTENVFRGTGENIAELRPNRSTFTANQELASGYAPFNKKKNFLNSESTEGGLHSFYKKNSKNSLEIDANNTTWTSVDLSNRRLTKDYFERNIKGQEDQITKIKDYLSKMKQEPNGSWKAPDGTTYSNDLYKNIVSEKELYLKDLKERYRNIDNLISNPKELEEMKNVLGNKTTTDDIADYIEKRNLDYVKLKNIEDTGVGDVTIVNHKPGNYLKSAIGNNGMFDMTNPNIYKALLPGAVAGAAMQNESKKDKIEE